MINAMQDAMGRAIDKSKHEHASVVRGVTLNHVVPFLEITGEAGPEPIKLDKVDQRTAEVLLSAATRGLDVYAEHGAAFSNVQMMISSVFRWAPGYFTVKMPNASLEEVLAETEIPGQSINRIVYNEADRTETFFYNTFEGSKEVIAVFQRSLDNPSVIKVGGDKKAIMEAASLAYLVDLEATYLKKAPTVWDILKTMLPH